MSEEKQPVRPPSRPQRPTPTPEPKPLPERRKDFPSKPSREIEKPSRPWPRE